MNLAGQIVLVRIQTDAGIEGIGEASPMYPRIICTIVNEIIAPILAEQNPFEMERLYDQLLNSRPGQFCNYKLGPGGALTSAIRGVEVALWEIMEKALGQPVYAFLGGFYRQHGFNASKNTRCLGITGKALRRSGLWRCKDCCR